MATRHLAAIMFTDMVGYTALMQENEQLALEKRGRNKTIFEDSLSKISCLYYYNSPLLAEVAGEERILNLRREYGLPV